MRFHLPALLLLGVGAAGCNTQISADLGAEPMDGASSVKVAIQGITLQKSDGSDDEVDRNVTEAPNLLDYKVSGSSGSTDKLFEIVGKAKVSKTTYTGISVKFATSLTSTFQGTTLLGNESDTNMHIVTSADFLPVDFKLANGDSVSIELVMDLRLSVARLDSNSYELTPVVRAVVSGDEAEVGGTVAASFIDDTDACAVGAAVYAFQGNDVTPKERTDSTDTSVVQPFATTPIVRTGISGSGTYRLRFLPAGKYTLAVTCDGERENGIANARDPTGSNDSVGFNPARINDLDLSKGEVVTDANFQ